jgi:HK97 gp10 family phage protein
VGRFNHFGDIAAQVEARGTQLVSAYAAFWQNAAAQLAPVDTGSLKGSVGSQLVGPHDARVFATMEYAKHQEYGTIDMPAQPFMRPSRDNLAAPFQRDMKRILKP